MDKRWYLGTLDENVLVAVTANIVITGLQVWRSPPAYASIFGPWFPPPHPPNILPCSAAESDFDGSHMPPEHLRGHTDRGWMTERQMTTRVWHAEVLFDRSAFLQIFFFFQFSTRLRAQPSSRTRRTFLPVSTRLCLQCPRLPLPLASFDILLSPVCLRPSAVTQRSSSWSHFCAETLLSG